MCVCLSAELIKCRGAKVGPKMIEVLSRVTFKDLSGLVFALIRMIVKSGQAVPVNERAHEAAPMQVLAESLEPP